MIFSVKMPLTIARRNGRHCAGSEKVADQLGQRCTFLYIAAAMEKAPGQALNSIAQLMISDQPDQVCTDFLLSPWFG